MQPFISFHFLFVFVFVFSFQPRRYFFSLNFVDLKKIYFRIQDFRLDFCCLFVCFRFHFFLKSRYFDGFFCFFLGLFCFCVVDVDDVQIPFVNFRCGLTFLFSFFKRRRGRREDKKKKERGNTNTVNEDSKKFSSQHHLIQSH